MSPIDVYARARTSIKFSFFFIGVPVGTLVPRLAEIKLGLNAGAGIYGTAIAVGGIGALIGNFIGARVVHRFGSRAVVQGAFTFLITSNVCNALAPNLSWFATVAFTSGLFYAMTNIGVNSQAVLVEQHIGRSFLPMGHAFWSIGTMSASIFSSLAAPYVSPLHALIFADTLCLIGFALATKNLLPLHMDDRSIDDSTQLPRQEHIPRSALRFLLTIAFAQWLALIAEISVGDWSSVLLSEDFHISVGPNGYAFSSFMVMQLTVRLLSPRFIDRFGLQVIARTCGVIGGTGYILALAAANVAHTTSNSAALMLSCIAYGFMGLGVAPMPAAFVTAAGRIPGLPSARALMVTGAAVAVLNIIGRMGFAFIAQHTSLPISLGFMGAILIAAAMMTNVLHIDKAERHAIQR